MTKLLTKNRFNIGDTAYAYNVGMQFPLIRELTIVGIVENEDGMYYTNDMSLWIKDEFLFDDKDKAYKSLIIQAEKEMDEE